MRSYPFKVKITYLFHKELLIRFGVERKSKIYIKAVFYLKIIKLK